jgi:4-amino-4-deoxy-L-arabinose transferase-like glycosyltransferase
MQPRDRDDLTVRGAAVVWLGAGTAALAVSTFVSARRVGLTVLEAAAVALGLALAGTAAICTWLLFFHTGLAVTTVLGGALAIAVAAGQLRMTRGETPDRVGARRDDEPRWGRALAAGAAVALVVTTAVAVVGRPFVDYDALLYHGPAAASMLQTGSLWGWPRLNVYMSYPALGMVLPAVAAWSFHSAAPLDTGEIGYFVVLLLVVWAWVGRGRPTALGGAVALAVAIAPPVFDGARSGMVDVAFGACVLLAAWLAYLWAQRDRTLLAVWSLAAFGAAAATKPIGAVLALVGGTALVVALLRRRPPDPTRARAAVAGVAVLFAFAAPFYIRNAIEQHNPLAPAGFRFGPLRFAGVRVGELLVPSSSWSARLPAPLGFGWNVVRGVVLPSASVGVGATDGGWDRAPLLLALVVLAVAGERAWRRSHGEPPAPPRRVLAGAGFAIVVAVATLAVQPQAWIPRFSIPAYALLAIAAGLWVANRVTPATAARVAAAVAAVSLLWVLSLEGRMDDGLWHTEVNGRYSVTAPRLSAPNRHYGTVYTWVAGVPCGSRITVVTHPSADGGAPVRTWATQLGLALWGNGLCNHVTLARATNGAIPSTDDADYAVIDASDRNAFESAIAARHRRAALVADNGETIGPRQLVYRVEPSVVEPQE